MIRLCTPVLDDEDKQAVQAVLESGYLVQGPNVKALEDHYSTYFGQNTDCALVSNGTAALHLALLSQNIGQGDIVFVSAYSWPATANVIEHVGATPVFVDVDRATMNINGPTFQESIDKALQSGHDKNTFKAAMVVHAFGLSAPMDELNAIAKEYNMAVIEDAACALGSLYKGSLCGTHSDIGCFSLHPRKAITTGEGGMCISSDEETMRKIRAYRNHGQDPEASSPEFMVAGLNYRLTDFQAALGLTQMKKLDAILERRRKHAKNYDALLADIDVQTPHIPEYATPNYQSYIVYLADGIAQGDVISAMRERGIETNIGTYHMPMIKFFREKYGFKTGDFPNADYVFSHALALPLAYDMSDEDQEAVAAALRDVLEALSAKASRSVSTM